MFYAPTGRFELNVKRLRSAAAENGTRGTAESRGKENRTPFSFIHFRRWPLISVYNARHQDEWGGGVIDRRGTKKSRLFQPWNE
jgi:hypothetical protein